MPNCSAAAWSKPRWPRNWRAADGFGRRQLVGVELLGDPVGLDQPLRCGPRGRSSRTSPSSRRSVHAVLVGEPLDGLGEGEPVDLHQEGDDVAALAAAEAVPELARGRDVERRRLLVVEGAQALQRAAAGVAEGDVAGDDLVDARLLAHLGDVVLADPPAHPPVTRPVTCLATRGVYAAPPTAPDRLWRGWSSAWTGTHQGGSTRQPRRKDGEMTFSDPIRRSRAGPGTHRGPTLGALVHDLSTQIPDLIRSELRLAQAEMAEKGKRAGLGIGLFSGAGLLAFFGVAGLITTAILALDLVMDAWLAALARGARASSPAAACVALAGKKQVDQAAPPSPNGRSRVSRRTSPRSRGQRHMSDTHLTPDELEAEIEAQREQLADTVDQLAAKLDVKAQAKAKAGLDHRAGSDPRPCSASSEPRSWWAAWCGGGDADDHPERRARQSQSTQSQSTQGSTAPSPPRPTRTTRASPTTRGHPEADLVVRRPQGPGASSARTSAPTWPPR